MVSRGKPSSLTEARRKCKCYVRAAGRLLRQERTRDTHTGRRGRNSGRESVPYTAIWACVVTPERRLRIARDTMQGHMRDIPSWDQYYLDICKVVAARSKDPNTQIGCVIIGPNREIRS